MMEEKPIDFVFSFRSPYARLAATCVLPRLPRGSVVRWRPFFPLPTFTNFPPVIEAKFKYLIRDVTRLSKHYGLRLEWPPLGDPDWAIPHVAFLAADELGRGPEFGLEIFEARFGRGQNVAEARVLQAAAEAVGLDPRPILSASTDATRRDALAAEVQRAYDEDGIFGVPTLILPRGTRFWG